VQALTAVEGSPVIVQARGVSGVSVLIIGVSKMFGMGGAIIRIKEIIAQTVPTNPKLPLASCPFRNQA
jgi:hypothetical protein